MSHNYSSHLRELQQNTTTPDQTDKNRAKFYHRLIIEFLGTTVTLYISAYLEHVANNRSAKLRAQCMGNELEEVADVLTQLYALFEFVTDMTAHLFVFIAIGFLLLGMCQQKRLENGRNEANLMNNVGMEMSGEVENQLGHFGSMEKGWKDPESIFRSTNV